MKVGIITGDHQASETGIGNYILNLIKGLKNTPAELSIVRHPRGYDYEIDDQIIPHTPLSAGLMIWTCALAAQRNILSHLDLVHSPTLALFPIKPHDHYVSTVHDIIFKKYPQYLPKGTIHHTKLLFNRNLSLSDRVIADSESTKRDLMAIYKTPEEKITVIPAAADERYQQVPDHEIDKIRKKYTLTKTFILYVGTIEPRKNITQILDSFSHIQKKFPDIELVIAGKKGWYYQEIFSKLHSLHLTDKVRFLGYVPIEDLPGLYNAAEIFVYPSQYEGFGLPPLEAMQCGTPVITSNRSSLPEVVGKEGIMVNPDNPGELSQAIMKLIHNPAYQEEQIQYGIQRSKLFSWKKTADMTYQVYEEVIAR